MTDRSYVAHNNAQRDRLKALVARCSDSDLTRGMPAGWTVSGVLGHLAFWDQRILELLQRWETSGIAPNQEIEADVAWINDAAKPLLLAVPPRKAAALAVAIAEATDRKVEMLTNHLIARNVAAGNPLNLSRADHRREHLDEIEQALTIICSSGLSGSPRRHPSADTTTFTTTPGLIFGASALPTE